MHVERLNTSDIAELVADGILEKKKAEYRHGLEQLGIEGRALEQKLKTFEADFYANLQRQKPEAPSVELTENRLIASICGGDGSFIPMGIVDAVSD
jgi:hypothetical protein